LAISLLSDEHSVGQDCARAWNKPALSLPQ
jgi:hypothetical protein